MPDTKLLTNPALGADDNSRCYANLDPEIHTYFFRKMFAGDRGVKQSMINVFFKAFHEECLKQKIDPSWDPTNANQIKAVAILNSITFTHVKPKATRRARA